MYKCKKCKYEYDEPEKTLTSMDTYYTCPECDKNCEDSEKLPDPPAELTIEERLRRIEEKLGIINFGE